MFSQVLMTCDAMGLIGQEIFAIDGVKLPSKERSGTHEELRNRADRLDKAADKILTLHQARDKQGHDADLAPERQARMDALRKEAARKREFVASNAPRLNRKGQELKTNITDPDSAKMTTSKGIIQSYTAQAAVDSANQIIIAADVIGSPRGRQLYSQRIGTIEPVFANIRHNKRLTRLNHRGAQKGQHAVESVLRGAQT